MVSIRWPIRESSLRIALLLISSSNEESANIIMPSVTAIRRESVLTSVAANGDLTEATCRQ